MILDNLFVVMMYMLGFERNVPKHDLHKKEEGLKLNDANIIFILLVFGSIILLGIFIFCGHCTDSGVFYNNHLY